MVDQRFVPPTAVQRAFRHGVELYDRGLGGSGLVDETIRWARKLARGDPATPEKVRKMWGWLRRHGKSPAEVAARKRDPQSPANVAWLLWGGDPAVKWVDSIVAR